MSFFAEFSLKICANSIFGSELVLSLL